MNLENEPTETISRQDGTDELKVVGKRLPAIPDAGYQFAMDTR